MTIQEAFEKAGFSVNDGIYYSDEMGWRTEETMWLNVDSGYSPGWYELPEYLWYYDGGINIASLDVKAVNLDMFPSEVREVIWGLINEEDAALIEEYERREDY